MPNETIKTITLTGTMDYPSIATEKYRAALERVTKVHTRFQKELDSIAKEIGNQSALSSAALAHCRLVNPHLDFIALNIKAISASTNQVGECIRSGRQGLRLSVSDVQAAIEQLRQRNQEMRKIRDIGHQVTESINKIAEIAIENKVIAINASVTASKASDRVKGFNVIANEITRLSAGMSERVGLIVDLAALVGVRMEQIMKNMDESIQSTQKALGNIDEAFNLLDHIDTTVNETGAANAALLDENGLLARQLEALDDVLGVIENNIVNTGTQADDMQATMRQQSGFIQHIELLLPELQGICDSLATTAGLPEGGNEAEEAKHLRCGEMPIGNYDPALTRMLREMHFVTFVCIRLLRYSSEKKLVPYLAETWFLHPDGKTWEFNLKDDVLFHDGSPVSGRDVKFSLERLMNPALASPYANLFTVIEGAEDFISGKAASVSGIVVINGATIQFRLKSSFNFFLSLLALSFSSIVKENRAIFSRPIDRYELVSAGPFRVARSSEPEVDRLECNPSFINGRPFLDSMEIRRNEPDIPKAIEEGRLDLGYNIPAGRAEGFKRSGFDGELRYYTSRYCYGLLVNYRKDNFLTRNVELRRAMVMAIDKDEIVRTTLGGKASRADSVLPPESLDVGDRTFLKYELQEAKRIFESYRSREDFGKPVNLAFRGYLTIPNLNEIAVLLEKYFMQLGLKVNISYHPATTPIAAFAADYDLVFLGFLPEIDLYSALEPFINPEGGDNYFGYDNPELLKMLNDSITIKDNGARKEFFIKILERLTLDVFMMPLFFKKSLCAIAKHVHAVFLNAEESFFPDAVYLAAKGANASPGIVRNDGELSRRYSEAIGRLEAETGIVVNTSGKLISIGQNIGRLIGMQRGKIDEVNGIFASFSEIAEKVQASRISIVEKIRDTSEEAGKSSQAAGLIQTGLQELSAALEGTFRALELVKKDIRKMLAVVNSINESNALIGSIAINAAIIAAKTDVRGGDLVKVSQSISEQAKRNTENTDTIISILEEMGAAVVDHSEFLNALVRGIGLAAASVSQSGHVLEKVGPLLASAGKNNAAIEETSGKLAALVREASLSVNQINAEIAKLTLNSETLQFGLDMERAVADVLKDVAAINKDIEQFLLINPN